MLEIRLNHIKMFAFHGYYDEEAILGSDFLLDISVGIPNSDLSKDDLRDTLNYESLFAICKEEMAERSALLEHVVYRIKSNIIASFPKQVESLNISLKKLYPPLDGSVESSQFLLNESYTLNCAKCNRSFSCFNSKECWCKEFNLYDVTRNQLARQYVGCLCEECLIEYKDI